MITHLVDIDGGCERVMGRYQLTLGCFFEDRKVDHKEKSEVVVALRLTEVEPELAEHGGRNTISE